jgi:hypothetical protein
MLDNEETRAILALLSASVITQLHKLERMSKQVVSQEEQEDGNWNIGGPSGDPRCLSFYLESVGT